MIDSDTLLRARWDWKKKPWRVYPVYGSNRVMHFLVVENSKGSAILVTELPPVDIDQCQ
jgi:hypothetical protein